MTTPYRRDRLAIRKNSGTSDAGTRGRVNFIEGANITLTTADSPTSDEVQVTVAATVPSAASPDAQYVTLALDATLSAERVLAAGNGLSLADGGAGGNATLAALSYILDQVTANTTVGGTAAETTIYTKSITGALLGTTKALRLTICGTITDSIVDTSTTITFRFKYGATTLTTQALTTDDGAVTFGGTRQFRLVFELFADGATNAQIGFLSGACPTITAGAVVVASSINGRGTAAIDSTANQNLVASVQWNAANANATMTMERAMLELL